MVSDYDFSEPEHAVFAVSQQFESLTNVTLQINTQVISFAKPTVEKIEVEYAKFDEVSSKYNFKKCQINGPNFFQNFRSMDKSNREKPCL